MTLALVVPDLDIWLRAFSRQGPDPLVVHAFSACVRQRQVFLVGLVRQALLARTRDQRQFSRLSRVLSGFPDLTVLADDHVHAAAIIQRLRGERVVVSPWQALLWVLAERIHGAIWSMERHWQPLVARGCPVRGAISD